MSVGSVRRHAPDSSEGSCVNENVPVCPYIDQGDARCASRLTLFNLRDLFRYCAGQHHACPIYHRIRREESYPHVVAALACPM